MSEVQVTLKLEKRKKVSYYGRKTQKQGSSKEDLHPVAFEFYSSGKRSYLFPGVGMTTEDFEKLKAGKMRTLWLKDIWNELQQQEVAFREAANELKQFSIAALKKELGRNPELRTNVLAYYEDHINQIKEQNRISTYRTYKTGLVSLKKFMDGKPLRFDQLSPSILESYEAWATGSQKNSISTVGINMRSLRTVVNAAIDEGLMRSEDSPFGKKKYQIPASKNIKKALTLKQIGKIIRYKPVPGSAEEKYRDLWLFLYFGNGMNVTDMCRLKNRDLGQTSLTFIRTKTKRSTRSSQTKIKVSLIDPLGKIINRYRNNDHSPNAYLFPFLLPANTESQIRDKVHAINRRINRHMKSIGKELEIDSPITSYTARHSFASTLKKSNQPATIIAEFLGHKSISTTQSYLDSIEDDQQEKIMQNLIPK